MKLRFWKRMKPLTAKQQYDLETLLILEDCIEQTKTLRRMFMSELEHSDERCGCLACTFTVACEAALAEVKA